MAVLFYSFPLQIFKLIFLPNRKKWNTFKNGDFQKILKTFFSDQSVLQLVLYVLFGKFKYLTTFVCMNLVYNKQKGNVFNTV